MEVEEVKYICFDLYIKRAIQNVLSILMIIVMIKSIMIVLTVGSLLSNVHIFNFLNLQHFTKSLRQRKLESLSKVTQKG